MGRSVENAAPNAASLSRSRMTSNCQRCLRGRIVGIGDDASCFSCGFVPISENEYASAEKYLASLKRDEAGLTIMPRSVGIPTEKVWE